MNGTSDVQQSIAKLEAEAQQTLKYHQVTVCATVNHVISWSDATILDRESHHKTRQLKESIYIIERTQPHEERWGAISLAS